MTSTRTYYPAQEGPVVFDSAVVSFEVTDKGYKPKDDRELAALEQGISHGIVTSEKGSK